MNIPVYKPKLSKNVAKYVNECIDKTWISSKGEFINDFEDKFAKFINAPYATTVSNGTVALHLALHVLGIGKGDEVIMPTLTYVATANAVAYVGATPVFVDSDKDSWNIDINLIEKSITKNTKALLIVHLYGACCEMNSIKLLCEKHKLYLIEDVAEAFGTCYQSKSAGTFGDLSTFSFFGNKTITTGEGGMVVSNNLKLIEKVKYFKSQSVSSTKEYWHDDIGFNFRMTNICAAIGVAQLEIANDILIRKREILNLYKSKLEGRNIKFQTEIEDTRHSYWMVSILLANSDIRDLVRSNLSNNGVETRPLFHPVHTMPVFYSNEFFPVAENLSKRGINLPSYPDLLDSEIDEICEIINTSIDTY